MYDFESLVGELLQARPELTRQELNRRIDEKKKTVGAGYLTDQGALFLVAGELGVSLRKEEASSDMSVKDLYIGANDVTVVARLLSVYPEATYNKKDGGTGKYRRLVLFDGNHTVRLTAWEEKAEEISKAGLKAGDAVRVSSAYVKQGLDGKPNLNLGKRGKIEAATDAKTNTKLVPMSSVTEKLTKVTQEKQFVAVESVVMSEPRYSEFVRSDGSPGSLFQFGLAGDGGKEVRIVVWSPTEQPELKRGQKVVVTNVRARKSNNGEYEIHGDAGSTIVLGPKPERLLLRVAGTSQGWRTLLAVDKSQRVKVLELSPGMKGPNVGDVIGVTPDSESDGRIICRTPGSIEVLPGTQFPVMDDLVTKLKDAKVDESQVMVEVIALSHGTVDDVRLKDGTMVKKGELVVGDDTAETKLVAWRDVSGKLSGIQPGERLKVIGATVKPTRIGTSVLQLSAQTSLEKLSGRP